MRRWFLLFRHQTEQTFLQAGELVRRYDNEWGYSNRVADLLRYMLQKGT